MEIQLKEGDGGADVTEEIIARQDAEDSPFVITRDAGGRLRLRIEGKDVAGRPYLNSEEKLFDPDRGFPEEEAQDILSILAGLTPPWARKVSD